MLNKSLIYLLFNFMVIQFIFFQHLFFQKVSVNAQFQHYKLHFMDFIILYY